MKAIIIGNGRSLDTHLKKGHFDMIGDVPTFAMNNIDMLYNRTKWRPTYWFFVENKTESGTPMKDELAMFDKLYKRHIEPGIENCIVSSDFVLKFPEKIEAAKNVSYVERCNEHDYWNPPTEWHVPKYCIYGGTINTVLMYIYNDCSGFDDIGIMGCDLGMAGENDHFDPDYKSAIEPGVSWEEHNKALRKVHLLAYERFGATKRRIVNIGICGDLDIYPRMSFEDWLVDKYKA